MNNMLAQDTARSDGNGGVARMWHDGMAPAQKLVRQPAPVGGSQNTPAISSECSSIHSSASAVSYSSTTRSSIKPRAMPPASGVHLSGASALKGMPRKPSK